MSAQHTPGPWRVFNHSWSDTSILADGFDHGICLLDINHATEESQEADEALMAANARLIAAAPELLEMLGIARNYIEATVLNASSPKTRENYSGCLRRIDAAIAKATGSAS